MLYSALFELNLEKSEIIFIQVGALGELIKPNVAYDHDESLILYIEESVYPDDRQMFFDTFSCNGYRGARARGELKLSYEYRALNVETGKYEWFCINAMFAHERSKAIGTIENIHASKIDKFKEEHDAQHDLITDLWNKKTFDELVLGYLAKEEDGIYILMDIDNFKNVNDLHGHVYGDKILMDIGDKILMDIGDVLRKNVPSNSCISRFEGNKFAVFIRKNNDIAYASQVVMSILRDIKELHIKKIDIGASLGIAIRNTNTTLENLEENAEIALQNVKTSGKNSFLIYKSDMQVTAQSKDDDKKKSENLKKYSKSSFNRKTFINNLKQYLLLYIIVVFAVIIFGCCTIFYTRNLKKMVEEESYGYLVEISDQIGDNFVKLLDGHFAVLDILGDSLQSGNYNSVDDLQKKLKETEIKHGYSEIAAIDENGVWYTQGPKKNRVNMIEYVSQMRTLKEPTMTDMLDIEGIGECVVFLVPVEPVKVEDVSIIGFAAVADTVKANEMITLSLFENRGYAHLISDTGNIVIKSNHEDSKLTGYNIVSFFEKWNLGNGVTVEEVSLNLKEGKKGIVNCIREGEEVTILYTPIDYKNLFLFTVVPQEILTEKTDTFYKFTILACVVISIVLFALIVATYLLQLKSKKNLSNMAYVDSITGGCSKGKFDMDVKSILQYKQSHYTIIYANVERFKLINEHMGKKMADNLLKHIYSVFTHGLKENERGARIMADHFAILLNTQDIQVIKEKIIQWNKEIDSYWYSSKDLYTITISYGLYQIDEDNIDVSLLLDRANIARKSIKAVTKQQLHYAVYDEQIKQKMQLEKELEDRQEKALESEEFLMYLQPKYNPYNNSIAGAEALVRWLTKDKGLIFPDKFIPVFENNGFITKIDLFIFEEVCRFIVKLLENEITPIPISVNLSRVNLKNDDFINDYLSIISKYNIDHNLIEFEITETLIYDNVDNLNLLIDKIHNHGFRVSMDDFGSGYSSLNMLQNINMDVLKLDKNFFNQTGDSDKRGRKIIRHVIDLAKDLDMEVVAEGVEEAEQVEFLKEYGCSIIQGYYYSRPQPAEYIYELIVNSHE